MRVSAPCISSLEHRLLRQHLEESPPQSQEEQPEPQLSPEQQKIASLVLGRRNSHNPQEDIEERTGRNVAAMKSGIVKLSHKNFSTREKAEQELTVIAIDILLDGKGDHCIAILRSAAAAARDVEERHRLDRIVSTIESGTTMIMYGMLPKDLRHSLRPVIDEYAATGNIGKAPLVFDDKGPAVDARSQGFEAKTFQRHAAYFLEAFPLVESGKVSARDFCLALTTIANPETKKAFFSSMQDAKRTLPEPLAVEAVRWCEDRYRSHAIEQLAAFSSQETVDSIRVHTPLFESAIDSRSR